MQDPAARFTLRQLSCFVAACDGGGIGAAAARLHLAQATVSAAIADLERTLGVQLLVRGRRRAAMPSPAGRELLAQAAEVLAAAGRLDERSAALRGDVSGELPIGCLVTLAPAVAPAVCRAFEGRWPRARVALVPAHQAELLARLDDGTIALAITYDLGLRAGVEFEPLAAAPPYALVAERHPLAGASEAGLEQLAGEPFVLLDLPLSRDYFLDLFRTAGIEPDVARRVADAELARSLVAWGYGFTLANARPAPARAVDGTPLRAVRLRTAAPPPRIGLARRGGLEPTRAAAAFATACAEVVAERWDAPA
jgi:DNA-binding transcriptional LysR family regulator